MAGKKKDQGVTVRPFTWEDFEEHCRKDFENVLDTVDPHQYISLGMLLAVRVADVLTLKEKDTNTIRGLLRKLFEEWLSQQKKESNPRTIVAQKLRTIGLNSQADLILVQKAVGGKDHNVCVI